MDKNQAQQLLERLYTDDEEALHLIFKAYYPLVCQCMLRIIPAQDTVEDLAQEVFIRFWQKRHQIVVNTSLQAYLRQMAINEALGYLRRRRFFEEIPYTLETDSDPIQEAQFTDLQDAIREGMDKLPPKCKVVFTLSRFEGLSYAEIAEKTGVSLKTVENQISKALKIMRNHLGPYLDE